MRQKYKIKRIRTGKVKLFLGGIILWIKDPKNSTRKLMKMTNISSKWQGKKKSTYKIIAPLYIKTKHTDKEIMPFTIPLGSSHPVSKYQTSSSLQKAVIGQKYRDQLAMEHPSCYVCSIPHITKAQGALGDGAERL